MYKTIEGRWGPIKFLLTDQYVGRSLYYYGEYNPDETEMIRSLANGLCLDIGANMGVITQALLVAGHEVIAFEPQLLICDILRENCAFTESTKYQVYNTAVGSECGVAEMPKVQYGAKNNFGGLGIGDKSIYGNITVPMTTIDSYQLDGVGFIKIDVEGFEYEVLVGATETIKRCKPILYIEDDRVAKRDRLRKQIQSMGYTIEEHKPTLYRKENFFNHQKNVWDKNYASHNLICRPL